MGRSTVPFRRCLDEVDYIDVEQSFLGRHPTVPFRDADFVVREFLHSYLCDVIRWQCVRGILRLIGGMAAVWPCTRCTTAPEDRGVAPRIVPWVHQRATVCLHRVISH